jgi:hypothetical protein
LWLLISGAGYTPDVREEARPSLEDVVDRAVRSMAGALVEDWNVPSEREALLEIALAVERRRSELEVY